MAIQKTKDRWMDRLVQWRPRANHRAGEPVKQEVAPDQASGQVYGMDRRIRKKRWTPKRIAWVSAAGLFLAVVIYNFLFGDHSSRLNVDTERITISTVEKGPFQEFIPVNGTVFPLKTFFLDAVEGGKVEKIFVEAGNVVNKGDPILKLSNAYLQLDAMNREAQLFDQMNNLRNTRLAMEQNRLNLRTQLVDLDFQVQRLKRSYERKSELSKRELISREDYEKEKDEYEYLCKRKELMIETQKQDSLLRQVQVEKLEAAVKHMQTNLDMVKQNVENLVVKAPISGQLTSLNAEIGQSKSPREALGQIDVLEGFKVRAQIDEHYITRIQPGLAGEFDLAGTSYRLALKKVYPEVRQGSFEVDLEFNGAEPKDIRRGQTLQVRLELGDLSEAVLLARGGFYQKTGGNWVYVLDQAGGVATKRQIRLGRQNPQAFEVLEGLAPGERAITSSYDNFGDIDKLILKK